MRQFPVAFLLLGAVLLSGCAAPAGPGARAGDPFIVNSQRTLFYSFGPAQSAGPDFALYHGQRVTMLSYQYGYSHIAVEGTGQTGYVASEDLTPAPALPKPSPSPGLASNTHHRHRHGSDPDESRPPTAEEQSQVPLPEFPESKPPADAPSFRY